jgi:hypothetical protein
MSSPHSRSASPSRTGRSRAKSGATRPTRPTPTDANTPTVTRPRSNSLPDPNTAPDNTAPANTAANNTVTKTKRNTGPTASPVVVQPVRTGPSGPTGPTGPTGPNPTSADFATHLPDLQSGKVDGPLAAFTDLRKNQAALDKPTWAKAMRAWIDGVFDAKEATDLARTHPALFVSLVEASRDLAGDPDLGPSAGYTDGWLTDNLKKLTDPTGAAAVAESLVSTNWTKPQVLNPAVRGFICAKLGGRGLSAAPGGLAARFINMLWNDEDYGLICDLIKDGIDTAAPAYYGMDAVGGRDGAWCGYIQPIEHILGRYLRLAEGDKSLTSPAKGGIDLDTELVGFAERSPSGSALPDRKQKVELGARKLKGATDILKALTARKDAKILTSFTKVKESELLAAFAQKPGTIWGFEDVRMPYVQAAHAVPGKGQQPVRMWELWEMVGLLVAQGWYEPIMSNPPQYIPQLVGEALKRLDAGLVDKPAEYIGRNTAEFRKAFEAQCTAYLHALVKLAPRAKYATAGTRGHDVDTYLGSFGCNAGLWWALETKTPVYYCLDGLKDDDLINYKKVKTSRINTFINEKDKSKRKPYIEGITLAEIREILKRWDKLGAVVKFARQGKFLTDDEVLDLKARMEKGDLDAGKRLAPDLGEFATEIGLLGPGVQPLPSNEVALSLVAQAQLLRTAAKALHSKVLPAFFATKGYALLVQHAVLPNGFAAAYQTMLDTADKQERKRLAAALVDEISDTSTGTVRVCDDLRQPLIEAINGFADM